LSRIRTLLDKGVMVAAGSDCHACHPFGPIHFILRAVNRGNFSCEAPLSLDEAIRIWTINSAYVSFAEDKKGSLECGKLADFIVLSEDPYKVNLKQLDKIEVEKTFVGGKMVWDKEISTKV
jgi:predicted amidohydrolase YtcJ